MRPLLAAMATVLLLGCTTGPDGPGPVVPATPTLPTATVTAGPTPSPTGVAATPAPDGSPTAAPATEVAVFVSVVASGLAAPWEVAFAPDGRVFVIERDSGRILELDPDGATAEVRTLSVDATSEGGLLGLAVGPDFADDEALYVYLTADRDNRVLRVPLDGGDLQPVLTGIPKAPVHNGGRIAFGPDGLLYVATGDAAIPNLAQDQSSLAGKILRVDADGRVPDGNPFPGSPVWSLGHRNVQGLAWDAAGELYATEFGPDRDDEINRIVPGGNYGWPEVTGVAGRSDFIDPIVVRQPAEASWSGAVILVGGAIPQWEGDLFVAALRGQRLWRFSLAGDASVSSAEELLVDQAGRLRRVAQAPDGSLWVLTNNRDGRGSPGPDDDRILRLGP
jgi:glucose/arabinose dehydrogenase